MSIIYVGFVPHPPIIVPEVGQGEEVKSQKTIEAYQYLAQEIVKLDIQTLLIVSPHAPLEGGGLNYFQGEVLTGSLARFCAPQVSFQMIADTEIVEQIKEEILDCFPIEAELDHGVLVPLYFLKKAGWDGKLVVLGMPRQKAEAYGRKVGQILNDSTQRCALLASGDLSHKLREEGPYGFDPSGPKVDRILRDGLNKNTMLVRGIPEKLIEQAAVCGYQALLFALGVREGSIKVLSYEGPFGVGYLIAEIYRSSPVAGFARECLTYYLTAQAVDKLIIPGDPILKEKKSCFVTLKKDGELRGCIGTVQPLKENLASEIRHNVIAAGTQDQRFWPVQREELPLITISVDVLGDLEKISSEEGLDPKRYGVVVRSGGKVGLLLPRLDGIDSVEEQLRIARQKAGISGEENIELWKFEADRYFE